MSDDNKRGGDDASAEPEPKIFAATITPHRSLGSTGFLILMLCIGGVSFVSGMVFLLLGAWPVFGFLGLDVLLIYWAFRANFRAARAYEEVTVTASELTVRKVSQQGIAREWTLNPVWVQLERIVHEEFGIERLFLVVGRPAAADCRFPGAPREGKLRAGAFGGAGRGQARTDPELKGDQWPVESGKQKSSP